MDVWSSKKTISEAIVWMSLFSVRTVVCSLLDPILYLEMGILSKDLWDEESSCYLERDGGNK